MENKESYTIFPAKEVSAKIIQKFEETKEWISDSITTAKTLQLNLKNYTNPETIPQQNLQQLKELLSEAKSKKTGITELLKQGNEHLLTNYDQRQQPLNFDLANLNQHWLELKQILKELSREARILSGKKSDVCLYYSVGESRQVSPISRFRIPTSDRKIAVSHLRRDPKKSLLKEKGRTWVTKLSIPYRVFIKSKVKQRYKGRSSTDTSFNSSDLDTITESSWDSVFSSARSYCSESVVSDLPLDDDDDIDDDDEMPSTISDKDGSSQDGNSADNKVKLDVMKATFPKANNNLSKAITKQSNNDNIKKNNDKSNENMASNRSSNNSSPKTLRHGTRSSPVSIEEQSPIVNKRRRLNSDDSVCSNTSQSPRESPVPMIDSPLPVEMGGSGRPISLMTPDGGKLKYPKPEIMRGMAPLGTPLYRHFSVSPGLSPLTTPGGTSTEDLTNLTFDGIDSSISSTLSTPVDSPYPSWDFRKKYKKDELWAAIRSDYQYLMDEEIIETCKSTESDLSWESDEGPSTNTAVSFTEFLKQYNEMTDWLNQIQAATLRKAQSLSEKYLNQSYHEEMLVRTPRKKLFNDYGKQLIKRYPTMKEEIVARQLRVNTQWQDLEAIVSPQQAYQDEQSLLKDLEEDMSSLRKWLHSVEGELTMQNPSPDWTPQIIQDKINSHKILQKDIESHSKIISSVLKVCERLKCDSGDTSSDCEKQSVQLVAVNLERRWHNIWLQSLEWQCRLEEALAGKGFRSRPSLDDLEDSLCESGSTPIGTQTETCTSSSFGTDPIEITPDNRIYKKKSGKSSGESDFEYYSDTSNYDVIPFSENEYEKISIDTDTHTEDDDLSSRQDDGKYSPDYSSGRNENGSGCDTDHGIDSALGRSYSDQSIGKETRSCPSIYQSTTAASQSSDETDQPTPTKVIVAKNVTEMNVGGTKHIGSTEKEGQSSPREASDVGYSSESHSNEELDINISIKEGNKSNNRPSSGSPAEEEPSATSSPQLGNNRKVWRHSMTSAYDTCSTGSDPNLHHAEDDDHLDLEEQHNTSSDYNTLANTSVSSGLQSTPETVRRPNSASHNFYCMTSIEGDTDPSSSIDPASTYTNTADQCESGNTSDLDSELSKSLEIPFDEDPAFSTFSTIEEEEDMVNEDEKPSSRRRLDLYYDNQKQNGSLQSVNDTDSNLPGDGSLSQEELDSLTNAASTLLNYIEKRKPLKKSDSLSVQVDSDTSTRDQAISEDEWNSNTEANGNQLTPQVPSDAVRKLIQQAESLVGDNDLLKLQNHKWPNYVEPAGNVVTRKSHRHKRRIDTVSDSLNTSTDGSVVPRFSSCDASSEGDFSESGSEYSPSSSDGHNLPSIIEVEPKMSTSISDYQVSDHLYGPVKMRHKKTSIPGDRPRSVTELYEKSSGLDLSPFSISEGAIHQRSSSENLSHKLRKTLSEQAPLPVKRLDSPKKSRRRRSPPLKGRGKDRGSVSPVQSDTKQRTSTSSQNTQVEDMDVLDVSIMNLAGTETTDDGKSTQVNSAAEFEENAWDNYQALPYSSVSSDCGEEKLDASALQADWEHHLEFDEDFTDDQTFVASMGHHSNKKSNNKWGAKRVFEDSDSDLEDFQNVIMESQKALSFTDNTLRKPHKDPMETGIYLDPSEYNESLATCRTQMKCLGVVVDTLQSEMGLTNVTQHSIQQVLDIIEEWRVLEKVAIERLHQSQELSALYKDMVSCKASLGDIQTKVNRVDYRDCDQIEQAIKSLQGCKNEIECQRSKISDTGVKVIKYENNHESINMSKYKSDIQGLHGCMDQLIQSCESHSSDLQTALLALYDFNEHHKDLQYSLDRERQQVRCLQLSQDLVTLNPQEVKDALQDLRKLESEFPPYNGKLQLLRTLHRDIAPCCHRDTDMETKAKIGLLDNQLVELKQKCESLGIKMEQRLSKDTVSQGDVAKKPSGVTMATASTSTLPLQQPQQRSMLMRILRATLPFNLLILAILILAYLMDPDVFENFGIVFSPQLKYVRGPPPT